MSEGILTAEVAGARTGRSRVMGAAFIVAGTSIGAGMFSLPVVTSGMWFGWSVVLLMVSWYCMYSAGLYLLETNLQYPSGASFDTMAADTLGNIGRTINGLSVAFVCYILTYAYISGGSSIVSHSLASAGISLSGKVAGLIFAVGLAAFVVAGARAVDRITTIMLGGMVISFLMFTAGLLGKVEVATLFPKELSMAETSPFILMAIPFIVVSFGFQTCIPSLVKYLDRDSHGLRRAIMIGSGLAVVFYLLWQLSVLGNLGRESFPALIAEGGNIGSLVRALENAGVGAGLSSLLQIFSNLAVATSFLGVALGLYDYLADVFGFKNDLAGRLKTAAIAFVPPTVLGLFVPDGFIAAIGFASVGATIFCIIVPALMAMRLRKRQKEAGNTAEGFRVAGGQRRLNVILIFGFGVLLLEILNLLGALPKFG